MISQVMMMSLMWLTNLCNKQRFISPRGFVSPRDFNVPSLFPAGPVLKCFVIPPNSKIEETKLRKNRVLDVGWHTNLPRFRVARLDHVRVESSSCCFLWESLSFVCLRELVSFDPRHVTRSPPIGKRILVGTRDYQGKIANLPYGPCTQGYPS